MLEGNVARISVSVQLFTVTGLEPYSTWLFPRDAPKSRPIMQSCVPAGPWSGSRPLIFALTVTAVEPDSAPRVAVMVVVPSDEAVTNPVALMVATAGAEEPQLTELVRSCVLPSVNTPVALSCAVVVTGMVRLAGEIVMEPKVAWSTVNVVVPQIAPAQALTVVWPTDTP